MAEGVGWSSPDLRQADGTDVLGIVSRLIVGDFREVDGSAVSGRVPRFRSLIVGEHLREVLAVREKGIVVKVEDTSRWACLTEELALVVQPKVGITEIDVIYTVVEFDGLATEVDFQGDVPSQPEEVSAWVLSHITKVSQLLGVSFEVMKLRLLNYFRPLRNLGGELLHCKRRCHREDKIRRMLGSCVNWSVR